MLTKEQRAEINRTNALKSTGPKTVEGKNRSSLNATRHGLTGQVVVMPAGDMEAYLKFQAGFHEAYRPKGPVETQCVQFMVDAAWKINQSTAWHSQILSLKFSQSHAQGSEENRPEVNTALDIADAVSRFTRELANLSIYEQRQHRIFERSHDRLMLLQRRRKEQERTDLQEAGLLLKLHEREEEEKLEEHEKRNQTYVPLPYDPKTDGFVFSVAEIKQHICSKERSDRVWTAAA